MILVGTDWMTPIISYLNDGRILKDYSATQKLKVLAPCFMLMGHLLYNRGFSLPYLRCLVLDEVSYIIREVHEVVYGNHSRVCSLAHKLIRARYY